MKKTTLFSFLIVLTLTTPKIILAYNSPFGELIDGKVLGTAIESRFGQLLQPTPVSPSTAKDTPGVGSDSPRVLKVKSLTIAVLGDSMIDVLQPELPQLKSALKKYFPATEFKIYNFGVGASNLEYAVYRLNHEYDYLWSHFPPVLSVNPDFLVLESFAYNNFGDSQEGIDKQWLLLGEITTKIKELSPKTKIILASTITPNSAVFGNGISGINWPSEEKTARTNTIKKYLQNLVNFATSQRYPLADAYHSSMDKNGEGDLIYINAGDNLHPSGPGGEFFCQKLAEIILKLLENNS